MNLSDGWQDFSVSFAFEPDCFSYCSFSALSGSGTNSKRSVVLFDSGCLEEQERRRRTGSILRKLSIGIELFKTRV
jgi:hypothetical protein